MQNELIEGCLDIESLTTFVEQLTTFLKDKDYRINDYDHYSVKNIIV